MRSYSFDPVGLPPFQQAYPLLDERSGSRLAPGPDTGWGQRFGAWTLGMQRPQLSRNWPPPIHLPRLTERNPNKVLDLSYGWQFLDGH